MPKKTQKNDNKNNKKIKSTEENNKPSEILDSLEKLAEDFVLVESKDYRALADILTVIESIVTWAESDSQEFVVHVCKRIISKIEGIILESSEDADADVETAGMAISGIQAILRDGRDPEKVEFPSSLNLVVEEQQTDSSGANLPSSVDQDIFEEFLSRQTSSMDDLESYILALEQGADDKSLSEFRRYIHTLKGESGLLGLTDIETVCHTVEDVLNKASAETLTDQLLIVKDWLVEAFDALSGKGDPPKPVGTILSGLLGFGDQQSEKVAGEAEESLGKDSIADQEIAPSSDFEDVEEAEEEEEAEYLLEGDLDLMGDFVAEANEHLDNADVHLLTLETNPQDEEAINAVFRAFHTIKGVAGFLKLTEIGELSHESENLLDKARKGDIELKGSAIDVTFESVDTLKRLVNNLSNALSSGKPLAKDKDVPKLVKQIRLVLEGKEVAVAKKPDEGQLNDSPIGEILIEKGQLTESALEVAVEKQKTDLDQKKLGEILVENVETSSIQVNKALEKQEADPDQKIGEILVEDGVVARESVDRALLKQKEPPQPDKIGIILAKNKSVPAKEIAQALRGQKGAGSQQRLVVIKETVKVEADRLDRLLDLIGELVIAESMVTQSDQLTGIISSDFSRQIRHLDKITRELQEMGTSLRMVPVRPIFQKMARLVRDLSRKSNKTVEFIMNGEDTELDKTVVDQIGDPLVHMVRNSIDHGIESDPEDRIRLGKNASGRVQLRAFHKGGSIYIEIEDDGKGLNKDAILKKALERGLIREDEQLTDKEIYNLIFEPGFSTAKKVTDVSGRGVGMDVVRKNIEKLRGQVEIRSEEGKGSVFTLRLPLTLAIIDGMVVKVGNERYIIPTLSVVRSIKPEKQNISTVMGKGEMLQVQGELMPIFRLNRLFTVDDAKDDPTKAIVVVVEDDGLHTGLLVDDLLGQQQIVIKSLGESLKNVSGLSGGAIMPDGRVGLILDVSGIVRLANSGEIDYEALREKDRTKVAEIVEASKVE